MQPWAILGLCHWHVPLNFVVPCLSWVVCGITKVLSQEEAMMNVFQENPSVTKKEWDVSEDIVVRVTKSFEFSNSVTPFVKIEVASPDGSKEILDMELHWDDQGLPSRQYIDFHRIQLVEDDVKTVWPLLRDLMGLCSMDCHEFFIALNWD